MLKRYFKNFKEDWITSWNPKTRNHLLISVTLLIAIVYFGRDAFSFFEDRETAMVPDPILALIPARNFSLLIFILIYSGLLASAIHHLKSLKETIQWIQTYTILITFRIFCIFLLPISAPEDIILLTDPVVDNIIGSSRTLTKDLFFSGHTSTAFLFFLMARNTKLRYILLVNCIAIAALLLWQHVHYTIDVVVAPIFAFFAYWIQGELTPFELNAYSPRKEAKH